jgi:hypothetical protein
VTLAVDTRVEAEDILKETRWQANDEYITRSAMIHAWQILVDEVIWRGIQYDVRPFDQVKSPEQIRIPAIIAGQGASGRSVESMDGGTAFDGSQVRKQKEAHA